jgi:hypothetical protein
MRHAMPEATVLYTVTAVVVAALVVWVAVVLKTAKEPWARPTLPLSVALSAADEPDMGADPLAAEPSRLDADSTSKATPAALAEEAKKAAKPADEPET